MANHPSAIKRHKQSEKRRLRNRSEKAALATQLKKARSEIEDKKAAPAAGEVRNAVSALGKAASKGILTKKTAARRISRLMKRAAKTA
jgi:small subunit ribosomal protein S20